MPIKSDPRTWTDQRHRRGLEGEELAMEFLERRGWRILDHRFRMGRLEIDLVAQRDQVIAFIEVKTRFGTGFGSPLEAVRWVKRRGIARVARAWIDRNGGIEGPGTEVGPVYRFDVIGITGNRPRPVVEHVEDAFWVDWR